MNIGVVLKPGAPQALQCLNTVLEVAKGHRVLIEGAGYHALDDVPAGVEALSKEEFAKEIELLVILGGDGHTVTQIQVGGHRMGRQGEALNQEVQPLHQHQRSQRGQPSGQPLG